jgi:hypothetical protein
VDRSVLGAPIDRIYLTRTAVRRGPSVASVDREPGRCLEVRFVLGGHR